MMKPTASDKKFAFSALPSSQAQQCDHVELSSSTPQAMMKEVEKRQEEGRQKSAELKAQELRKPGWKRLFSLGQNKSALKATKRELTELGKQRTCLLEQAGERHSSEVARSSFDRNTRHGGGAFGGALGALAVSRLEMDQQAWEQRIQSVNAAGEDRPLLAFASLWGPEKLTSAEVTQSFQEMPGMDGTLRASLVWQALCGESLQVRWHNVIEGQKVLPKPRQS